MKMRTLVAAAAVGFTMLLAEGVAAAEIKVLSVVPLKTSLDEPCHGSQAHDQV